MEYARLEAESMMLGTIDLPDILLVVLVGISRGGHK